MGGQSLKLLLDTHAVLWAAENDSRLGNAATSAFSKCSPGEAVISDITLLEIAMLEHKERVRFGITLRQYLGNLQKHFPLVRIEAGIAAEAFELELAQFDPFDRVIVATAKYHNLPLLTRDTNIRGSGLVRVIW